jgi:hypothetical protein
VPYKRTAMISRLAKYTVIRLHGAEREEAIGKKG